MEDVCRVDILETAQDLVDEGLEVGVGERLARPNDGGQVALHELYGVISNGLWWGSGAGRTLIEVAFVEVIWSRNVHVVEACYLQANTQHAVRAGGGAR